MMVCAKPPERHYTKHESDSIDLGFEWKKWLAPGDVIASSSWAVTYYPDVDDITLSLSLITGADDSITQVRVSGGSVSPEGDDDDDWYYWLTNSITLADGQVKHKSLKIFVVSK